MPIGDGEEFYSEQAAVFMISDNEIVKHHQDEQFEKLFNDARTGIGNRLMNWSEKIREQVANFCVKVNEKHRWFVYVYLRTQHTLDVTMKCIISKLAIVLFALLSTMKKKEIPVNQILRINLVHIIDEKAPEVHLNPFTVYYRTKSAENKHKLGAVNLNETRMTLHGLKNVLKQILASPINTDRIGAV